VVADKGADIKIARLDSGVTLATEAMENVASVAIGCWVGAGSRDEPKEWAGASHFLEHLLFKGTPSRPGNTISEALDAIGGDCNAFTTKEYTAFYVRLLAEDAHIGFDILCDILEDPALLQSDVDAERGVILDEILAHNDEPAELAGEAAMSALFVTHPLGRDTLGSISTIEGLDDLQIRDFFQQHYRPSNMVFAVAGKVNHDEVSAYMASRLSVAPGGERPVRAEPMAHQNVTVALERPTEQAQFVLAARTSGFHDPSRWALAVYSQILGGGLSSRLFRKVREERGLAYSIWSERVTFSDAGALCVSAGTAPRYVDEVIEIIVEQIDSLARGDVTEKELEVAKSNLRAEVLLASEDSGSRLHRLGGTVLAFDRMVSVEEVTSAISVVNRTEIARVGEMIALAQRAMVLVGPMKASSFERRWGN
jgi:predicted Zn-dependent peptidase